MGGFRNALRPLGARNFRVYTAGNAVSLVGNWLQRVSVGWLAWQLTHSTVWLGVIAAADLVPTIILSPYAGALADRIDRLRLIVLTQIAGLIVALLLAWLAFSGALSIFALFGLSLLLGAANALNQPARLALVANLVATADLGAAVAINALTYNLARFIGPALAGAAIARGSMALAFALNAVSYGVFLIALARLRGVRLQPQGPRRRMIGDAIEGYAYAIRHPAIGQLLALFALTAFSVRGFNELFPGFTDLVFHRGPQGLAWLTAMIGAGAVFGGVWMIRRNGIRGLTMLAVNHTLVLAGSILTFAATRDYWIALVALFFVGFAMVSTGIAVQTVLQTVVDPAKRGRVMGLYGLLVRAGPPFNALVMGWLSSFAGLHITVAIGAILCLLYWLWARLRRNAMEAALVPPGGSTE